jgi:glyoxylase-like metal-dependent hydrolase (beta-lactamase superfamily II)
MSIAIDCSNDQQRHAEGLPRRKWLRIVRSVAGAKHYTVGAIDIAVVSDGTIKLDGGAVFGLIPRIMWEPVIGRENIDAEYRIPLGLNCMVVRSGGETLIVDTGMGNKLTGAARERSFPGDYGYLLDELRALGIAPDDVTAVANTHLHADHCGWNTVFEGDAVKPTFPNARYFVQRGEYEAATHPNERTRGTYFADNFEPLARSGQLELVDGEREIIPGVEFLPTPGHTADHASILMTSGGETGIYTGDLVHHAVQAERPAWIAAFDVLPLVTLETKKAFAERAVREQALLICVHNAFPGVGRLTERDGRRTFTEE